MSTATLEPIVEDPLVETPLPKRMALGPRGLGGIILAIDGDESLLVAPVSWHDYVALSEFRTLHRPNVRMAYDRGRLEIMTVGFRHEFWKGTTRRLLEAAVLGYRMRILSAGNMTIHREDLARGFEPDECYYVQNAHKIDPHRELDFRTDPPPDLAIEIEMSRKIIDRLPLYASLGILEVWRVENERLTILLLGNDGVYSEAPVGRAFPSLPATAWNEYLARSLSTDVTDLCLELMDRVRTPAAG